MNSYPILVHTARHAMGINLTWNFLNKSLKKNLNFFLNLIFKDNFRNLKQKWGLIFWLRWSRNKVVVGEPVAGLKNPATKLAWIFWRGNNSMVRVEGF